MSRRLALTVTCAALFFAAFVTTATAQVESLDNNEFACRDKLAKALSKLGKAEGKCTATCRKNNDFACTTCFAKVRAVYQKVSGSCSSEGTDADSCPEGWERTQSGIFGGPYSDCSQFVGGMQNEIDQLVNIAVGQLWCDDSVDFTKAELMCESKAMAAYGIWGGARGACFRKCRVNESKGLTSGSCAPNNPTDGGTAACTNAVDTDLLARLHKACDADAPECATSLYSLRDGALRPIVDNTAVLVSDVALTPTCGNSIKEYPEDCDGTDFGCAPGWHCSVTCTCE